MSKANELKMATMQELRDYLNWHGWEKKNINRVERMVNGMTRRFRFIVHRPYYADVNRLECDQLPPFGVNAYVRNQKGYRRASVDIIDVSAIPTTNH